MQIQFDEDAYQARILIDGNPRLRFSKVAGHEHEVQFLGNTGNPLGPVGCQIAPVTELEEVNINNALRSKKFSIMSGGVASSPCAASAVDNTYGPALFADSGNSNKLSVKLADGTIKVVAFE